jgi:periplasmic mercuric ion binding protein
MNFAKKLSVVALAALAFASCKNTNAEPAGDEKKTDTIDNKTTAQNLETASFKIDGMMCPTGCAATIEKKLAKMEGVEKARVDFDSKTATIEFDPAKQTAETFAQTVEKMGEYKVSDVKSSSDKAMLYQQEPKKKEAKKTTSTATAATSKSKKEAKPATCSGHEKGGGCCSAKKETKSGKM